MTQWKLSGPEISGPDDAIVFSFDAETQPALHAKFRALTGRDRIEYRIVLGTSWALIEAGAEMSGMKEMVSRNADEIDIDEVLAVFDQASAFPEAALVEPDGTAGAGEVILLLLRNRMMTIEEYASLVEHIKDRLEVHRRPPARQRAASRTSGRRASASPRGS